MTKERACANTPALLRRSFLAGVAASLTVAPRAGDAAPEELETRAYLKGVEDGRDEAVKNVMSELQQGELTAYKSPIQQVFEKWKSLYHKLNSGGTVDMTEEEYDDEFDVLIELENKIVGTPAQSPEDVLCKITAQTHFGAYGYECKPSINGWWSEVDSFWGHDQKT